MMGKASDANVLAKTEIIATALSLDITIFQWYIHADPAKIGRQSYSTRFSFHILVWPRVTI